VKFHHSKLNFKWAEGGEEVKWHQDITFFPHTNYSPLTIGTCLNDVGDEQGPLGVFPGSHKGDLFNQYNDKDQWVGCLNDEDLRRFDMSKAVYLTGPAGSITIHNCRTVHGSKKNMSDTGRPLLLNVYSSADAFPYTPSTLASGYEGDIVRGKPARWAHHDPRPCLIPPDWSGGYTSIYALQQEEEWDADQLAAVNQQGARSHGMDELQHDPTAQVAE
jgi:ectoine hydroxylase-related dioxygenase (phytanoyl-CoA dioxygenase family)